MSSKQIESHWRALITEQEGSGLSVREFAEQRGLSRWSLYGWRSKFGRGHRGRGRPKVVAGRSSRADAAQDLVAVEILGGEGSPGPGVNQGFDLHVGDGIGVRVPHGFDGAELARLVSALRSSC